MLNEINEAKRHRRLYLSYCVCVCFYVCVGPGCGQGPRRSSAGQTFPPAAAWQGQGPADHQLPVSCLRYTNTEIISQALYRLFNQSVVIWLFFFFFCDSLLIFNPL